MTDTLRTLQSFLNAPAVGTPAVIPDRTREDLPILFATLGYQRGAEVGVWEGAFSARICEWMPGVDLTCVDPWAPYTAYRERKNDRVRLAAAFQTTQERLQPFNCHIWKMTSLEAAARVPDRSLDFVYLDGNHAKAFVREDLAAWTPKIRSGGILAGHDYFDSDKKPWIEVKGAVDTFTADRGISPWFVLAGDKAPSFCWVVA